MKPHEPTRKIMEAIMSFPCLAEIYRGYNPEHFTPDILLEKMPTMSSGEWQCSSFILTLWNPGYAGGQLWEFDLMKFMAKVDLEHRRVLARWINEPSWP